MSQSPAIQALLQQALRAHQTGEMEIAKAIYKQIINVQPHHPDALHLLGVVALQQGDTAAAIPLIKKAIKAWPKNPSFYANLAQAYLAKGNPHDAHAAFQKAQALDPRNPQFAVGKANCLVMQGRLAEAEQQLRLVVQQHPAYALAWLNLGHTVRDQRRAEESLDLYRHVAQLDPAWPDAWSSLGAALHQLEHFEEAELAHRRHLELDPTSIKGFCNLASVLMDRGRFDDAVALGRQGLALRPDAVDLQLSVGAALMHLGQPAAALTTYRAAVALAPDNARGCLGYGLSSYETGEAAAGRQWLGRALELQGNAPEFQNALATAELAFGEFQDGWRRYEGRPSRQQRLPEHRDKPPALRLPAQLQGETVCLLGEQGLGDQLFFVRFMAVLRQLGANPICQVNPKLLPLLERNPSLGRFISSAQALPASDSILLMGDLPRALGEKSLSPWPGFRDANTALVAPGIQRPPFPLWPRVFHPELPPSITLAPLASRLESLKRELEQIGPPPYVGVTWRAGTAPESQRGQHWALHKAIPLDRLADALRPVEGTLLALQRNPQAGEIEAFSSRAGRAVSDFTAINEDLESMLALLALLDDYVSVSNTNVHLCAAAGRTARVLVPRPTEWRWMYTGRQSPWFPGFTLYRQGVDGDWSKALAQLTHDMRTTPG